MADVSHVRTFLAVYRTGSFTRAAAELHLTQPAVSQHIRALETGLGRQLFVREARGASPTAAGMELATAVAGHLDAVEAALEPDHEGTVHDTVYLGGPAELITVRVVPELAPLIAGGLRVRMFFETDRPVVARLLEGQLDLAILTGEWRERGLESERLCFERLVLVASPAWASQLGALTQRSAPQLANVPLIAYDEDLPLVADFWRTVFGDTHGLQAAVTANGLRACLELAIRGAGMTVLPEHVCDAALRSGEVIRLIEPVRAPRNQLYLAWRAGSLRRRTIASVHERLRVAARAW